MNPLFVALDTTDPDRAAQLVGQVRPHVGGLKIGLEYFCAHGPAGVARLAESGLPLFLDLKFHDIPNTVAGAVRAMAPLAPALLTVHAAGGRAMLEAARAAAPAETRIVAVTVLTSLDDADLRDCGVGGGSAAQVERLAAVARSAGVDGLVCSGQEVARIRPSWPDALIVVPGLRLDDDQAGGSDQKRVMTPRAARDAGASILVVGRPITQAADPAEAARRIAATL